MRSVATASAKSGIALDYFEVGPLSKNEINAHPVLGRATVQAASRAPQRPSRTPSSGSRNKIFVFSFRGCAMVRSPSLTWAISGQHNKRFDYPGLAIKGRLGIGSEYN